jgi:mannose-1-phosphate guanylyltransferase / mannose-6-phosphate isomerase
MPAPIVPIILAGGTGTRLWPVSRDAMPKQFLAFSGPRTTYQETLLRVKHPAFAPPVVITGSDFRFYAQRQAEDVDVAAKVVIEPARRDSGPAIAAATLIASKADPNAVVLALAADHIVPDAEAFRALCAAGSEAAAAGHIVTFGIKPAAPKTAYGYILPGDKIGKGGAHKVARFVEKPDAATAEKYVRDGYLWNSGNFLFRADVMLDELRRLQPAIVKAAEASIARADDDLGFLRLDAEAFTAAPQISIDYAVMEKTERAAVVSGNLRWSDIGSWDALPDILEADHSGNVVQGHAVNIDSSGNVIHAGEQLVTTIGLKDTIVVSTKDAVMVAPRARAQEVRELVGRLKAEQRPEADAHRRVDRPWGYYESLDMGERFQVKRIVVYPGGMLSLQKHNKRAEHWVVVRGNAEVTIGDKQSTVRENESVYIPMGSVHRLANKGSTPLELIEVQTGTYFGEDDIVRLDDIYKRK